MSVSSAQAFTNDIRSRFDKALKTQLSDLQKLGLNISTSVMVAEMRKIVGDTLSFVTDTTNRLPYRVKVLDELIGWLYSYFDGKSDEAARNMLACWAKLVHKYFYGKYMMLYERSEKPTHLHGGFAPDRRTIDKIGRRLAEWYLFECGRLVVSVAFDQRMYVSEFTALIQQMTVPGTMGDLRYSGSEMFADEINREDRQSS